MSQAEAEFFKILSDGLSKEGQLSDQSIAALDVQQPELLGQLEEQAAEAAPQEEQQEDPSTVEVSDETTTIEVPANIFKVPDSHPLKLAAVLKLKYKDDWVEWLPETLWTAIRKDIGPISEINQNKVQALAVSLSTDAPWQDWTTFENCGRAFNDTIPIFGQLQPLSPAETAFTVHTLKKLQNFALSDEVLGYIAAVCLYNGIIYAPTKWFGRAQWLVDKQNKQPDLVAEIKAAWQSIENQPLDHVEFQEDKPIDVHIAKLWAIREYIKEKEARLKEA